MREPWRPNSRRSPRARRATFPRRRRLDLTARGQGWKVMPWSQGRRGRVLCELLHVCRFVGKETRICETFCHLIDFPVTWKGFEGFGIRMWLKNCGSGGSVDKNPRWLTQRSSKNQRHWKRSESKVDSEVGKEAVSALRYRTFVEARLRTILYASPRSAKDGGGIS
jgi:hypothetical protein